MSRTPDRKAIPTLYRGVQYRSRLEARYACFFDLLGWTYQYEPFDLEGWIPDFLLPSKGRHGDVLVEVKPVTAFPIDVAREIERTSWRGHALIVGCMLSPDGGPYEGTVRFGWYSHLGCDDFCDCPDPPDIEGRWDEAAFFGHVDRIDFSGVLGSWSGILGVARAWDGPVAVDLGKDGWDRETGRRAVELWDEAGNLVQWRGIRSVTD